LEKTNLNKIQQMALLELTAWQYQNDADKISPTIWDLWWLKLNKAIWEDDFGKQSSLEMRYPNRDRTWRLIRDEPQAPWFDNKSTPAKETLPLLVNQTFRATIDSLARQHGDIGKNWQWAIHKGTSVQHLAKLPGFGREQIFIGGGRNIVNAASERNGPSWRMVVALGPEVKGYGLYPGGQSGNPGSFFYDNLIDTWSQGQLPELVYLQKPTENSTKIIGRITLQKK
jgi:penicillin amidase